MTDLRVEYLHIGWPIFYCQIDSRFEIQDRRLQEHTDRIHDLQDKVDFFVRTNVPPVEQVFFDGEFFEARVLLERLIKTAIKRVIIIDAYIDAATFDMLVRTSLTLAKMLLPSGVSLRALAQRLGQETIGYYADGFKSGRNTETNKVRLI